MSGIPSFFGSDHLHKASALVAAYALLSLAAICVFLFASALPLFSDIGILDFLFGMDWYPTDTPPVLGILPMLVASLAVTALAAILAVPLGVMTAIFLNELAPEGLRRALKPAIELLAALPSVVIGFFGMVVVAPILQELLNMDVGLNLFTASVMLAFMSVPTICSVSEDALRGVPVALREASLALGATRNETIFKVVLPAARSGIGTAVMLGMARSIGETMVVLMVAGGAGIIPLSLFDPVRPLTATIAAEMAETPVGSSHYHALFAIGAVLFLLCLAFNLAARAISRQKAPSSGRTARLPRFLRPRRNKGKAALYRPELIKLRLVKESLSFFLLRGAASVNVLALTAMIALLVYRGVPAISWEFLTGFPQKMMTEGGIFPCIVGTLLLSLGAMALAFPLGVLTAIYLAEYSGNSRFSAYVRMAVNNLAGVPSIVFGLFGFSFFSIFCGLGVSLASGVLTLSILSLPVIISTSEEALRQVPVTLREASLALGATKPQTIGRTVIPAALPGMLTGSILGMARAAGETAAIMFTAAVISTPSLPSSPLSPVMALPTHVYTLATSGVDIEKSQPLQYGTSLVLLLLVLGMNLFAIIMRDKMQRERL